MGGGGGGGRMSQMLNDTSGDKASGRRIIAQWYKALVRCIVWDHSTGVVFFLLIPLLNC